MKVGSDKNDYQGRVNGSGFGYLWSGHVRVKSGQRFASLQVSTTIVMVKILPAPGLEPETCAQQSMILTTMLWISYDVIRNRACIIIKHIAISHAFAVIIMTGLQHYIKLSSDIYNFINS